jgi:hypothetical protein
MTDEELVKRLRDPDEMTCADGMEAADRIEALTAKLAKALGIGNKMAKSIEGNYYIPGVVKEWRADLKQEGSKT